MVIKGKKSRGPKPRNTSICCHCGLVFERWLDSRGNRTLAKYCKPCCYIIRAEKNNGRRKVTRESIIEARQNNPCATLQEIGDARGVTRERIRQVLSKEQLPTQHLIQTYICLACGKDMPVGKRLFCNKECRHDFTHIKIACTYCGRLREYNIKYLIWEIEQGRHGTNLFFCSKVCQGKWAGKNFGFGRPLNYTFAPNMCVGNAEASPNRNLGVL